MRAAEGDKVLFGFFSTLTINRIRRGSVTQFCLHMGPLISLFTSTGTVYGSLSGAKSSSVPECNESRGQWGVGACSFSLIIHH